MFDTDYNSTLYSQKPEARDPRNINQAQEINDQMAQIQMNRRLAGRNSKIIPQKGPHRIPMHSEARYTIESQKYKEKFV